VSPNTHRGRHGDTLAAVLILSAAAMVVFARRWPVPAVAVSLAGTGAYFALGYATDTSFFIGLAVTAYRSASAGGRGRSALFAVATAAVFVGSSFAGHTFNANDGVWVSVIVVAALLVGQVVAELGARAERQAAKAHEEEASRRLAEERLRIARELHDVVSHSMAVINVQAGVAAHVIDEHPEQAKQALLTIKSTSQTAMRDLRAILGLMRESGEPEPLVPAPGLNEIDALVERVRGSGVHVELDVDRPADAVTPGAALTAYRIVQEALTNVVRHAPGASAQVRVRLTPEAIVVDVENDGEGRQAPEQAGAGHGLAGMRERVRAAGGSFDAGPKAQGGFSVHATLPVSGA
jgi:signal transduction histidine kinase